MQGRALGGCVPGNQFAGLTHLVEAGEARAGDRVALCGNGIGFNYSCAIVELTAEPQWRAG